MTEKEEMENKIIKIENELDNQIKILNKKYKNDEADDMFSLQEEIITKRDELFRLISKKKQIVSAAEPAL